MADLEDHARRITELIAELETCSDEPARQRMFELLEHVDHVHRSCVWRLYDLMTELGGRGLVARLTTDPAVQTLFMLYDLVPVDAFTEAAERAVAPGETGRQAAGFIPLRSIRGRKPSWHVASSRRDLPPGNLRGLDIEGIPVLLCAVLDPDAIVAYRNSCPGSVLPLHLGSLAGGELHCPWHGCRYDVRTGKRLEGSGGDLEPFRVSIVGDAVQVAVNV
jgi:nitrite reductase/ring-hydroxylating ferredoxin subunit